MKYICVALITLLLTGCLKVNRVTATESSAPAEVFSPTITGRACVNGNSMIRVRFVSAELIPTAPADMATWVYEYVYTSSYHIKTC
jgi:spore maturation protein SpmA